jgi:hypothetical protein
LRSRGNISNSGVLSNVLRPPADPTVTSQGLRVRLESKEIDLLFWKTQVFQNHFPYLHCHYAEWTQYHRNLPASLKIIDTAGKVMWRLHHTPFAEEKSPLVHIKHSALSLIYQPLDALLPIPTSHKFGIFSAYSCVAQNGSSRLRQWLIYHCVVSQPLIDFTGSILLAPSTTSADQSALVSIFGMVGWAMPVTTAITPLGPF